MCSISTWSASSSFQADFQSVRAARRLHSARQREPPACQGRQAQARQTRSRLQRGELTIRRPDSPRGEHSAWPGRRSRPRRPSRAAPLPPRLHTIEWPPWRPNNVRSAWSSAGRSRQSKRSSSARMRSLRRRRNTSPQRLRSSAPGPRSVSTPWPPGLFSARYRGRQAAGTDAAGSDGGRIAGARRTPRRRPQRRCGASGPGASEWQADVRAAGHGPPHTAAFRRHPRTHYAAFC